MRSAGPSRYPSMSTRMVRALLMKRALPRSLRELFDLSPKGIRTHLKLNNPIYTGTPAYGHGDREPGPDGTITWEKTDLIDELKRQIN